MEIFEIQSLNDLGHPHYLLIALLILIMGNYLKLRFISLLAVGIIFYDFFSLSDFSSQDVLHYSLDILLLAGLSYISSILNKGFFRISFFPIAMLACLVIHSSYSDKLNVSVQDNSKLDNTVELMVLHESEADRNTWIADYRNDYGIEFPLYTPLDKSGILDDFVGLNVPDDIDAYALMKELLEDPRVTYIEGNEILELQKPQEHTDADAFRMQQTGSDPLASKQWSLNSIHSDKYYNLIQDRISAQSVDPVFICILDTGTDAGHEDLRENFYSVDSGYDSDPQGHGTHCAGVAAAVTGNNIGIASLLPPHSPVKVSGIQVLNSFGIGTQERIIDGIIEAVDKGADVISLSLGALTNPEKEKAYTEAVDYARKHNCIVVIAAGNSSMDAARFSPANTKGVLTVSASNAKNQKASFANHLDNIDMGIYAPGEKILSCYPRDNYKSLSGTSMAAPYVAGFAGLMKYFNPDMTVEELYRILNHSADTNAKGHKMINAEKALEYYLSEERISQ